MEINKIIGYILFVIGLIIIFGTIFQSYNILTGKISVPLVFQTLAPKESEKKENQNSQQQMQTQIDQVVKNQINQILPPATITKILNLSVWTMLALILVSAGASVSGIGIKMIKV
jgi:heme/copper-type cytochrome/quinol oxidase subunit 3